MLDSFKPQIKVFSSMLILGLLFYGCELEESCPSCIDPDFTLFLFDTTNAGFSPTEIDSFYIIQFPPGQLNDPVDTTQIMVDQNPFILSGSYFGTTTSSNDYKVEGVNGEFSYEITNLQITIKNTSDDCRCDFAENISLLLDGNPISVDEPLEPILLTP